MPTIEPKQHRGHTFFEGANQITPFNPGAFYYMVSYQFQNGPGHPGGSASTSGLVYPKDKTQYGELVEAVLDFVRSRGMGTRGYQVIMFFDIKPQTEFRDPEILAREQAAAHAQRADQNGQPDEVAVAELMP